MERTTLIYQIEFFTYWHSSSGLVGGTDTHSTVIRGKKGLPVITGKTLKGLLRDAAESLLELDVTGISKDFIQDVFGLSNDQLKPEEAYDQWSSYFSNAALPEPDRQHILTNEQVYLLYDRIASTAIAQNGLAKEGSLRQMEVCVPLTLHAMILDFPKKDGYVEAMKICFKWVKHLGLNRHRGLGRCKFSLLTTEDHEEN